MRHHFMIILGLTVMLFAIVLVLKNETRKMKNEYKISEEKTKSFLKKMALMAIDKKYEEIIATNLTEDYLREINPSKWRPYCEEARDLNYLSVIKRLNDFAQKKVTCFPPLTKGDK